MGISMAIENSDAHDGASTALAINSKHDQSTNFEGDAPPRLSALRVTVAILVVVCVLGLGGVWIARKVSATPSSPSRTTWFAPYVDTTLTPTFQFQDPSSDTSHQSVLGFVVSSPASACTPSWGGAYSLKQADEQLNLGNRIAQYQAIGGIPIVSFGGKSNSELALNCTDDSALKAAYLSVINRYHLSTIDFDLEGASLQNWSSIKRRAQVVGEVENSISSAGGHLSVWVTLPVEPDGLQDNAVSVIDAFLHDHVAIAGINVMSMDFTTTSADMLTSVESSITATQSQLAKIFTSYGDTMTSTQVWNHLGTTVQIGQNDVAGQKFTVDDARSLATFATANHLGRVSMWSINRDFQCGTAFAEIGVQSNTCSGVAQSSQEFSDIFAKLNGTPTQVGATTQTTTSTVADNPATSPYPIWQPADPYVVGYKVVREGNIYQAKWYNSGQDPAAQVQYQWQTPWLLLGPVLSTSHAPTTTTLAPGTDPSWSPSTAYKAGVRVLFDGLPYQAKWYNTGESPAAEASDPTGSPWSPLFTIPGEPTSGSN
jgi:chitinase